MFYSLFSPERLASAQSISKQNTLNHRQLDAMTAKTLPVAGEETLLPH
jgi:hypothetical protein